ncbi:MAG: NADPH-dependent oxidoreductase, partial [Oscillospiraceae bacterium]|nr:NADPH-dependent oxidoreductase [Oscillospiraceae bacterium]
LTGLFRQKRFYDKAVFAIIVSGYSGSDVVARQLIGALNMNKSFYLPPRFALIEPANDPGEAVALPGIDGRIDAFAGRIRETFQAAND